MKKLLVCIDGSSYAEVCCRYAGDMAKLFDARIEGLYVSEFRQFEVPMIADFAGSIGVQPYQGLVSQVESMEEEKARLIGEAATHIFKEAGLEDRFRFHHKRGSLVDAVEAFEAEEGTVDFVMMGKRGENADLASGHLGSSLERVVRACEHPCLVTNRKYNPIKRLLIAYDGGASCRRAVEWFTLNQGLAQYEIHVVTVDEDNSREEAQQHLDTVKNVLASGGFDPVCQLLDGVAEKAIARYVSQNDIDMLVMGAYGHGRIRELLIGSTTTDLLRSCIVPVMMFR